MIEPFPLAADLPDLLEFRGEFGAEINSFVPFVHWLHQAGLLAGRRIRTYRGMRPFYYFLDPAQLEEVRRPRAYVAPGDRPPWLPNRDDHRSSRSPFEWFPDYRRHYRDGIFDTRRPLLVVHNKVTLEWGQPPVNLFSLECLDRIFGELTDDFQLVYVRSGMLGLPDGYSPDHQPDLPFDDLALLARHSDVVNFEETATMLEASMSYNEAKLRLYAQAAFHITVQGGNAHLLSLFSGGMVAILHVTGRETCHSYAHGHFTYAASPRPRWLICRSEADIVSCLPLFRDALLVDGQALLPPVHAATLRRLSPAAQLEPHHA